VFFKQFYLGCLAHASYLIGSEGEAVVIDPQRDVDQYLEEAKQAGLKIKYVMETHLHADFVSGHRELAERTGAQIIFGQRAGAEFPHIAGADGDIFCVGKLHLTLLETPGHTPESVCILLADSENQSDPKLLFSGDTLFIGDVGRPDLVASRGYSADQMSRMLYESIYNKLLKLDNDVVVYPAHGAGSLCGKNLSSDRQSTIGRERMFNYALQAKSEDDFVAMVTVDQPEVPAYFPKDVEMNRVGPVTLAKLQRPKPMTACEVSASVTKGAILLDIRCGDSYSSAHINGSLNIGLGGQFASWAGTLIDFGKPIIIICDDEKHLDEAVVRLARVGIESVSGYLAEGILSWQKAGSSVVPTSMISVKDLKHRLEDADDLLVVDVRRRTEFAEGHVPGAVNIPLAELSGRVAELEKTRPIAIICASGYRSLIACSILERAGFHALINVLGGTTAWKNAEYSLEARKTVTV
jgi:glyoxylase-like metal-dependent hydrolase (beta-lactamase superfamily II)/rhodanese-related sulfurtransferase